MKKREINRNNSSRSNNKNKRRISRKTSRKQNIGLLLSVVLNLRRNDIFLQNRIKCNRTHQLLLKEVRFQWLPSFTVYLHPRLCSSSFMQQLQAQFYYSVGLIGANRCQTPLWVHCRLIFDFWVSDKLALKSVFMAWAAMESLFYLAKV